MESEPTEFAKLSRNFYPSLSGCSALAGNRQYMTGLSIYYRDITCFWWLIPEKIAICLQCSGTKYLCFIWANWSMALRAVMVHSVRGITLLLASFDVVLPSEREKPSWIDWTIEISPSTSWVLLGQFPARMLQFRESHHTSYCVWQSLTSYRPVMHTRVRRRHIMRKTACVQQQVPQHLKALEKMGLSSRCLMILFASYCMALARECKNSSQKWNFYYWEMTVHHSAERKTFIYM